MSEVGIKIEKVEAITMMLKKVIDQEIRRRDFRKRISNLLNKTSHHLTDLTFRF